MRAVAVELNTPFPRERFAIDFTPGIGVNDLRYEPSLQYPYDPEMTEERWAEIVAEAAEQKSNWDKRTQRMDELVGQPAPPFPETTWLNSEPLT